MSTDNLLVADDTPHAISVGELTGHIKAILEGTFPSIWVAGEVSDVTRARSGHIYFTLKDEDANIRGIIWRSAASRMKEPIREGQSVLCLGDVEVYAARGTYQLVVRMVQQQGLGPLQQKLEKLRAKLHAEGLFAADRKRPIPEMPRRLGVITSATGAAVRDFLKAASSRLGNGEIVVLPTAVQGTGSVKSIVQAIFLANAMEPAFDLIVLTRGGGSLEDLWSFNDEAVVRAVADSSIPTISAIGHEIDITLCDLAADLRALTPTDAAIKALPDKAVTREQLESLSRRLVRAGNDTIARRRELLQRFEQSTCFRKPHESVQQRWRELDELDARGKRAIASQLQIQQAALAKAAASLSALSPLNVLQRGYSVTTDSSGQAIEDASTLKSGDEIETRLKNGRIRSVVSDTLN